MGEVLSDDWSGLNVWLTTCFLPFAYLEKLIKLRPAQRQQQAFILGKTALSVEGEKSPS